MPTSRKVLCAVYGVIAAVALVACWSQTVAYVHSPTDFFVNFWRDAKITPASRNITADALMLGIAVVILMVIEARKHEVRFVWAYIAACYFVAISVAFPLFLIARELRMGAAEPPRLHAPDTVLLTLMAVAFGALTIWIDVP
ncbi:DUF2834 domain-containing protein [Mycobacterium palustre]|uniref:DUF2834 domain-containing protein n=1 Tax=Mycobacterium palustre TaxID=153971 RepID=A0A1X1Z2Y6_9MYCO|nr:DUF2834 domain-containing protein [Mycobacterium palustre]MCV7099641.1 DUF2834 domain-containing protein [Mycobacterium palustre]ORW17685.1 hypothetical protein AWC19_20600 [Mycobacterium palustre]